MTHQTRGSNSIRKNHLISRGAIFSAFAVAFSCLGILSGTAFGQTLTLSQNIGPGGITVTATSAGFTPGFNTGFYVDGGFQKSCPGGFGDDLYANCSVQLTMPSAPGRTYTISASNSIGESANALFGVLYPNLGISPTCGPSGATITATGTNWAVGFDAGIYLDGSLTVSNNYPDSSGHFTRTLTGPQSGSNPHSVKVSNSAPSSVFRQFWAPDCPVIGKVEGNCGATDDPG